MDNDFTNEKNHSSSLKGVISLIVLVLVFSTVLFLINRFLQPKIEKNHETEALEFLLAFDEDVKDATIIENSFPKEVISVYKSQNTGTVVSEVIVDGYSEKIRALVGVDAKGAVIGILIISHNESKDLGGLVLKKDVLSQYEFLVLEDFFDYDFNESDGKMHPVDIVAGATFTSNALEQIVILGLEMHQLSQDA